MNRILALFLFLNKLGKWTITIKKGLTVLKTFDVNVIDK